MDIAKRILDWSTSRPAWQRDALRRLVASATLTDDDYEELTALCKSRHGLAETQEVRPLEQAPITIDGGSSDAVTLVAITHHKGVNALAEEQTVTFAPGLTVVYGDNAAGKSGYTRILKTACHARGAEEILGNLLADGAPTIPSSSIRFSVGTDGLVESWPEKQEKSALLGRVSVFDSHCAVVYLKEKTDVAFRPFGLDLFDKLSAACEEVGKRLSRERAALELAAPQLPDVPEGTQAQKLLSSLTSLTKPEAVQALGALTPDEEERLRFVEGRLADMGANDAVAAAAALELRARRIRGLVRHLEALDAVLDTEELKRVFDAQEQVQGRKMQAEQMRAETFPNDLLPGTGAEIWMALWEAARKFSEEKAYPAAPFPFTAEDALCVLCQQELAPDGAARLKRFQEFMVSRAEQELRAAREDFAARREKLLDLAVISDPVTESVQDFRLEAPALADTLQASLYAAAARHTAVVKSLREGAGTPAELPAYSTRTERVAAIAVQLEERARELRKTTDATEKRNLEQEYREFTGRRTIGGNMTLIHEEIERKKKIAAYGVCLDDTQTHQITRKSTELTKETVSERLKQAFRDELENFRFRHVEVELQEAGGSRGALYHKLVLKRAPGTSLPKVVSEGEQRCLSIAAFFAELSTADDPSAILFDDPVSSLDHIWRSAVARRLVREAATRQVIVFTHDIVFLLALQKYADEMKVDVHNQRLRRDRAGAGVSDAELPWPALKVKTRLGVLRNSWQRAEKFSRDGNRAGYEELAMLTYKRLRDTWERAYEEVLLDGTVERYRENIQTQHVRNIADITEQDCQELEAGMTKSSRWLHDQAPAEQEAIPEPEELKADIDALEEWVKRIRHRREKNRSGR